jgi:signal transduction histidine kinase
MAMIGAMVASVAGIASLAHWDSVRESAAALQDFAEEQATLAKALGAGLGQRASRTAPVTVDDLLEGLRAVERRGSLAIFVRRPEETVLHGTDGHMLSARRLTQGLGVGESAIKIPREEAAELGLPARTALAGLSHVDAGPAGAWDIVVVASAERERDRELWARRRLVLSVLTAAGLVLAFGGVAMRKQRKELLLERDLAIASLQRTRDERLERASKAAAMGTLAMGLAHELSTPLGVIAARAEQMLPKVSGDERLTVGMSAIIGQAERINQVMRGLLGLARGDAPSAERVAPSDLVAAAVGLVEHRFEKARVLLRWKAALELPSVIGDPRLLEQALVNLLLNACDACTLPGAEGNVVVVSARQDGGEIEIAVEDRGPGISEEDVGRALEPFFTTKAREGGTGLGLAIAQEIVANHRGRLVFSPISPHGTRAALRLPIAEQRSIHA